MSARLQAEPHRRLNPLTGDWVLVSPNRTQRPWQGQVEHLAPPAPHYDAGCYLCPGNQRAGGVQNPNYDSTFVFTNDFAALKLDVQSGAADPSGRGLLRAESEAGTCRVVCFSPRHDLTLARMTVPEIVRVVDVWVDQYTELGSLPQIQHVQIFENRGEMMGASNPHPHGQIWANATVPDEPRREQQAQKAHLQDYGVCLLCDYLLLEMKDGTRIVVENSHFVAVLPFWAVWPYELLILSKQHVTSMDQLDATMRQGLADILKRITTRYDNLFQTSFPYSMGFHQAPTEGKPHPEWHLHAHFYPPLLRSATVRKFMVGYEMLASPQRDITPEIAADTLRKVSELHYLEAPKV
ncbi:MAG: UDP-glucose--hexose-1-phosphate uridylyltransferase [Candidatus Sulfotelmatobacter sp.]